MTTTSLTLRKIEAPQVLIDLGDQAPLVKIGRDAMQLAETMTIDSQDMAAEAQQEIALMARRAADIEVWRKEITVPIDNAKRRVMDFVRPATENLENAQTILKQKCGTYMQGERERIAREQRQRDEEARRERERLEAEAREKDRLAREAAANAERKARAAQETQNQVEREQLEREAAIAAREAEEQRVAAATDLATAQVIVAAPVAEAPKVSGLRFTDNEDPEIEDLPALQRWVVANPAFAQVLVPDLQAIKRLRKAMKDGFQPAGVRFTKTLNAGRGAKAA